MKWTLRLKKDFTFFTYYKCCRHTAYERKTFLKIQKGKPATCTKSQQLQYRPELLSGHTLTYHVHLKTEVSVMQPNTYILFKKLKYSSCNFTCFCWHEIVYTIICALNLVGSYICGWKQHWHWYSVLPWQSVVETTSSNFWADSWWKKSGKCTFEWVLLLM